MRQRDFIKAIAGSSAAWPVAARAQQRERIRRIGSLTGIADDPIFQPRLAAFLQALQQLGWTNGDNVRVDYRWGGGDANRIRKYAAELVALAGRHPGHWHPVHGAVA
jgi:putative ABC transport system substrate-binding protein